MHTHSVLRAARIPMLAATVLTLSLAAAPSAHASDPQISATISPVHLANGVIELTGEYSLIPHISVAAVIGGGSQSVTSGSETISVSVLELGAQGRYYLSDKFEGLHGMVELLFVNATADAKDGDVSATANAGGTSAGAALGYKYMFGFGLTLEAQVGYQMTLISGSASATDGTNTATASEEESDSGPLVNLNLGWSF